MLSLIINILICVIINVYFLVLVRRNLERRIENFFIEEEKRNTRYSEDIINILCKKKDQVL